MSSLWIVIAGILSCYIWFPELKRIRQAWEKRRIYWMLMSIVMSGLSIYLVAWGLEKVVFGQ